MFGKKFHLDGNHLFRWIISAWCHLVEGTDCWHCGGHLLVSELRSAERSCSGHGCPLFGIQESGSDSCQRLRNGGNGLQLCAVDRAAAAFRIESSVVGVPRIPHAEACLLTPFTVDGLRGCSVVCPIELGS